MFPEELLISVQMTGHSLSPSDSCWNGSVNWEPRVQLQECLWNLKGEGKMSLCWYFRLAFLAICFFSLLNAFKLYAIQMFEQCWYVQAHWLFQSGRSGVCRAVWLMWDPCLFWQYDIFPYMLSAMATRTIKPEKIPEHLRLTWHFTLVSILYGQPIVERIKWQ